MQRHEWMHCTSTSRHLPNQLDLASVTEACLMSLSSTEYAFPPPPRWKIYSSVSDCTMLPFSAFLVRWSTVRLRSRRRPAMTTPAVFPLLPSGNLNFFFILTSPSLRKQLLLPSAAGVLRFSPAVTCKTHFALIPLGFTSHRVQNWIELGSKKRRTILPARLF